MFNLISLINLNLKCHNTCCTSHRHFEMFDIGEVFLNALYLYHHTLIELLIVKMAAPVYIIIVLLYCMSHCNAGPPGLKTGDVFRSLKALNQWKVCTMHSRRRSIVCLNDIFYDFDIPTVGCVYFLFCLINNRNTLCSLTFDYVCK